MAFIAASLLIASNASVEACSAATQKAHQVPPPPRPTSDPMPGPFLGIVDEQGALRDVGVAANATRSWAGPKLSAFSLCFQPASQPIDWTLALNALSNVSRELKAQGAAIVVFEAIRVCASPPALAIGGRPHVEIRGVIRSQD